MNNLGGGITDHSSVITRYDYCFGFDSLYSAPATVTEAIRNLHETHAWLSVGDEYRGTRHFKLSTSFLYRG